MGCTASEDFDRPLSEDLENQMKVVSKDKRENEVDRFESNKPEQGFVNVSFIQDDFFANAQESD